MNDLKTEFQTRARAEVSRRALLSNLGIAIGAAALSTAALPAAGAFAATNPSPSPSPNDVATSQRFDISGAGGLLVNAVPLYDTSLLMQSYAIDNVNSKIYWVQKASTGTTGNLTVTQTDLAGNITGHMFLTGFGHGAQIGVDTDPSNGVTYIWSEYATNTSTNSGFGTKIGRYPFTNGATLTSSSVQDRTPVLSYGTTSKPVYTPICNIDPGGQHLLVRYRDENSQLRVVVFSLADARANNLTHASRLSEWALADSDATTAADYPFQGFTAYGQYVYLLEGKPGTTSYITTQNLNSPGGVTQDQYPTQAGGSLPNREPQGMSIQLASSGPRLTFGLESSSGGVHKVTVYYKSSLI